MTAVQALARVQAQMQAAATSAARDPASVRLVAVSKTQDAATIRPTLVAGHRLFGENRVQEALAKWPALKSEFPEVELHLIGPLQSNKAAEAVTLFDVIQTVDRDKIAATLSREMARQNRRPKLLLQVNTGLEPQKAGVAPADVANFISRSRDVHGLTFEGLMCIPPVEEDAAQHFKLLQEIARQHGLRELSMGMSADYEAAIGNGATMIRVGSAIFGAR